MGVIRAAWPDKSITLAVVATERPTIVTVYSAVAAVVTRLIIVAHRRVRGVIYVITSVVVAIGWPRFSAEAAVAGRVVRLSDGAARGLIRTECLVVV